MNSRVNLLFYNLIFLFGLGLMFWSWKLSKKAEIIVEWTTASELNTVGFNILRSEDPAGPFVQVNPELIAGSADSLTGGSYKYSDPDVKPGREYFYMLEDMDENGATSQHGPIEAVAKGGGKVEFFLGLACSVVGLLGTVRLMVDRSGKEDRKMVENELTSQELL